MLTTTLIPQGTMVLMMGSKEEDVPVEPAVKPIFVEDMNEAELATAVCFLLFKGCNWILSPKTYTYCISFDDFMSKSLTKFAPISSLGVANCE